MYIISDEKKDNKTKRSRQFPVRKTPELIKILLKDRTTNKNIIWGTDNYIGMGKDFLPQSQMKEKWITNGGNRLVQPRVKKHVKTQSIRTRENAEVFTPIWIVKKQNDLVEEEFKNLTLDDYVGKVWLEITCGEAPYMCTRYDAVSGKPIHLLNRVGFVDRKFQRISKEIDDYDDWINYAIKAIESSYGYELQGDSLLIARENILYTFIDYYKDKFKKIPEIKLMQEIASIVSYNLFQMNGLKYTIPYSEEIEIRHKDLQLSLFDDITETEGIEVIKEGTRVKIKDWNKGINTEFEVIAQGGNGMKFDVVVGNPPYEIKMEDTRDKPIYHKFLDESINISDKVCLITPGRFLFNVGATPTKWNIKMLNDPHFKVVYYEGKSSKVFKDTDIKGGVAITYRDSSKKYEPIKIFLAHNELVTILDKVTTLSNFETINVILSGVSYYKFSKKLYIKEPHLKNRLPFNRRSLIGSNIFDKFQEIFFDDKINENDIEVYGRINNRRSKKWVNKEYIQTNNDIYAYKVILPASNGSGLFGETFSSPIVGYPNLIHTQTFISFSGFNSKYESENCLKYLKTKFTRAMLGTMKVTQHNQTMDVWKNVPIQNFTDNSDIDWSKPISDIDKQLYKKYKLTHEEMDFIENNVKEMV